MNPKLNKTLLAAAILVSAPFFAGNAMAAPPTTIVGAWTMYVNQNVETFVVTNQGVQGTCKVLVATLSGWPTSGWTARLTAACISSGRTMGFRSKHSMALSRNESSAHRIG